MKIKHSQAEEDYNQSVKEVESGWKVQQFLPDDEISEKLKLYTFHKARNENQTDEN